MINVTNQNFEAEVLQSQTPVVVLWGGISNVNSNVAAIGLNSFSKLAKNPPKLVRIDLNANADLAMQHSIRNEPYFMLFVNGAALVAETDYSTFMEGIKQWTN